MNRLSRENNNVIRLFRHFLSSIVKWRVLPATTIRGGFTAEKSRIKSRLTFHSCRDVDVEESRRLEFHGNARRLSYDGRTVCRLSRNSIPPPGVHYDGVTGAGMFLPRRSRVYITRIASSLFSPFYREKKKRVHSTLITAFGETSV